ncbi:MAG: diguanylate cyclase [Xanthomonadales bacterium]|nr:diguanylate cyclase [Xanthomonadales bacterium]MCC6595813.1 diguanylate cyclase [Rhodanobacteraceae bacterium]MDL1868854.1 diguanylate cyclase [Gammaproteobacteria bacterium PRO6]
MDAHVNATAFIPIQDAAFRFLLDEVGAFVYVTDREGRYTYANRLVLDLLGQPLAGVVGKRFTDFVDIGEDSELRETDRRVLEDGHTIAREESNLIHATGELRTYWSIKKPLRDAAGAIIGMIGISHDITDKKRLEDKVRMHKELLDTVLGNVDALVYMKGADRRFLYVNPATARVFGKTPEQVIGRLDSELMPQEAADRFWDKDRRIFASGQRHAGEESLHDADGVLRHYWSVMMPLAAYEGQPALIGLSTDITELHALKEELRRQAKTDILTGLDNRRSFFERAEEEYSRCRRHGHALSLVAIDIDHFKRINDVFGHPVGDLVLQDFAGRCRAALREEDLCARTGGEEFCVLLPEIGLDAAHQLAERLRDIVASDPAPAAQPVARLTISLGVASLGEGDSGFGSLFSRADRMLYLAKERGRNRSVTEREAQTPPTGGA